MDLKTNARYSNFQLQPDSRTKQLWKHLVGSWSVVTRIISANLDESWRTLATIKNLADKFMTIILPVQSIETGIPTWYYLVGLRGLEPPTS